MPENELLDRLFDCFRRYNYWGMKALRHELQQPEAYLRETLVKIADMPRAGPHSSQWVLKPELKDERNEGAAESSPGIGGMDGIDDFDMGDLDGDDDDDDENVKMEDVMPL
jgi:transcription initiation factor TFIIF subunit beta